MEFERTSSPMPTRALARDLSWIFLGAGFLFFVSLGARDLWNPNEPIYGRAVVEMAERGDWLIPTINDVVFAEKPILYFWGALAASELLGGVDELSLRLPAALAALASALMTYLLVLPYAGRRRALLSVALFATLYQVFWAARAVQMDGMVLAATLGVVLPLTRWLDHRMRPAPAFALAGLAAGLGFLAKGPVTLVLPGLVVVGYAAASRRPGLLLNRHVGLGAAVALAVCLPWYAMLWLQGETGFLYELLFRQNVTRFLDAWDHQQPWWYYLKYLWIDYAPWSLLLPAAACLAARDEPERRLHTLSWIWIAGIVFFFSLSESKRAPYLLPIAPAVAVLASGVLDRWIFGGDLTRRARIATRLAFAIVALVMVLAGGWIWSTDFEMPASLTPAALFLGTLLVAVGCALAWGLMVERQQPSLAPAVLWLGMFGIYSAAAVWIFPAIDTLKSAREFSAAMNQELEEAQGTVVSFLFWQWRSGYSYYGQRSIPTVDNPAQLARFWRETEGVHVLVEDETRETLQALLPDARVVLEGRIGSRRVFLFAKVSAVAAKGPALDGRHLPRLGPEQGSESQERSDFERPIPLAIVGGSSMFTGPGAEAVQPGAGWPQPVRIWE